MATMNISLPDKMKTYVESCLADDGYGNASEFFRDLIRRDQKDKERQQDRREQLEQLRADVQAGIDALRSGRFTEYESADALIDDIEKEGKRRLVEKEQ